MNVDELNDGQFCGFTFWTFPGRVRTGKSQIETKMVDKKMTSAAENRSSKANMWSF